MKKKQQFVGSKGINKSTTLKTYIDSLSLQTFNCWNCTALTLIPDTLTSLRHLDCRGCTTLTLIPNTLTSLQKLNCSDCTVLTLIPNTLTSLQELDCSGCTALTLIPDMLTSLQRLNCSGCTWLPQDIGDLQFSENVKKTNGSSTMDPSAFALLAFSTVVSIRGFRQVVLQSGSSRRSNFQTPARTQYKYDFQKTSGNSIKERKVIKMFWFSMRELVDRTIFKFENET